MNQKYEVLADALRQIARYEHCNCGCPNARSGAPLSALHALQIATNALKDVGEFIPVRANDFTDKQPVTHTRKFSPKYIIE
jgi:hypothetical protein